MLPSIREGLGDLQARFKTFDPAEDWWLLHLVYGSEIGHLRVARLVKVDEFEYVQTVGDYSMNLEPLDHELDVDDLTFWSIYYMGNGKVPYFKSKIMKSF